MDASNLNRREFLTGLAALTLVGAALTPTGEEAAAPAEAVPPAEVAEIDTSQWEWVVRNDNDADKIIYLKRTISYFEEMTAQVRALIAKIEAGLV